jgi:heptosyltransferase-2
MTPSPEHILLVLPNNLGDVIMATPVLQGLRAAHPAARISFFVEEGFEGGLLDNPHLDTLFRFPRAVIRDALALQSWSGGAGQLDEFLATMRREPISLVINLAQHEYLSYVVSLLGAQRIVGRHFLAEGNHAILDPWSRYLYAIPFARRYNNLHAVDVYRRIAAVSEHRGGYTLHIGPAERAEAAQRLRAHNVGLGERSVVLFQPGAASTVKQWPLEHFITLGRMLIDAGWDVVVSGGPAEAALAQALVQQLGAHCTSFAGVTTFRQSLALLCHATACVTPDTAMMHAAAAFDVQLYALFGTTSPVETGPYGHGHWVFGAGCAERPCFCKECKSRLCMKSILPQAIYHCMVHGEPDAHLPGDVYRTQCSPNGDYSLVAHAAGMFGYSDEPGCRLSRMVVGDTMLYPGAAGEGADELAMQCDRFVDLATRMASLLQRFVDSGERGAVSSFEQCKGDLEKIGGVGDFLAALLNLHLNSIALLDVRAGVTQSMVACRALATRVEAVRAALC